MDSTKVKYIDNKKDFTCVLGIVNSDNGRKIASNMLKWISHHYNVYCVYHDGGQFEYPALHFMQKWCIDNNKPCLYLHTRGAYNFHPSTTAQTHKLWEEEFGANRWMYFKLVRTDHPAASCPFTSTEKHTWYNGFVVNSLAMKAIPEIGIYEDRLIYEYLFKNTNVKVYATKTRDCLQSARSYLKHITGK